jgi:hypothetical protein
MGDAGQATVASGEGDMPIVMRHIEGRAATTMLCDRCGRGIDDAASAWYQWLEAPADRFTGEVFFLHKSCVDSFEEAHPTASDEAWANMELACFPIYVGNNISLDWDSAWELARFFG